MDTTLEQLDTWTNAHCVDPYDERYLDANFNPMSPAQVLENIRELERVIGERMIFLRTERNRYPEVSDRCGGPLAPIDAKVCDAE